MPQEPKYYESPKTHRLYQKGDYQTRMNITRPKGAYILSTRNSGDPPNWSFDPPKARQKRKRSRDSGRNFGSSRRKIR